MRKSPGMSSYHSLSSQGGCVSPTGGLTVPLVVTPRELQPPSRHEHHQSLVWLHYVRHTGHTAAHTAALHTCSHTEFRLHRHPGPQEATRDASTAVLVHTRLHGQSGSWSHAERAQEPICMPPPALRCLTLSPQPSLG